MHLRWALGCVLVALAFHGVGRGQAPPFVPPAPQPTLPPLFYVRVSGPPGMQATFFRGQAKSDTLATPCVVGLRPGYSYAFALSGIPGQANEVYCPTLEVRGSLILGDRMRNKDFPAGLSFTADDFARAKEGMVRKVIIVERPDQAIALASKPEQPIEVALPPSRDPFLEARERGQVLAVMYLGEKKMTAEELAARGLPGTVLLPGDKVLPPPKHLPWIPWACHALIDPVAGAAHPAELSTIYDGGDSGPPAGYDGYGKLRGLDPSDTVAEYQDSRGRQRIAASNRVCVCVPRFVVLRNELVLGNQIALLGPGAAQSLKGFARLDGRMPLIERSSNTLLDSMATRNKLSGTTNLYGTAITGKLEGLEIKATLHGTGTVDGLCLAPEVGAPLDRPLVIIKWPEKCGGLVGELVTFFVKYTNQGGRPISNVAISDSLAPRFEYVPGSAKSDREANFTIQPNEAGSSILRWEFAGQLLPRESGVVSFQARIR